MADNAQLISIVNRLAEVNKTLVLSGSLALHLQGVSLRREPHDIDVVVPVDFVPIRGMKRTSKYDFVDGRREYEDENTPEEERLFEITNYTFEGIEVDVFIPNVSGLFPKQHLVKSAETKVPLLILSEIIKYKIEHSFGTASTKTKHRNDIIHALINIDKSI